MTTNEWTNKSMNFNQIRDHVWEQVYDNEEVPPPDWEESATQGIPAHLQRLIDAGNEGIVVPPGIHWWSKARRALQALPFGYAFGSSIIVHTYARIHRQTFTGDTWEMDHWFGAFPATYLALDTTGDPISPQPTISNPTVNKTVFTFGGAQAGEGVLVG